MTEPMRYGTRRAVDGLAGRNVSTHVGAGDLGHRQRAEVREGESGSARQPVTGVPLVASALRIWLQNGGSLRVHEPVAARTSWESRPGAMPGVTPFGILPGQRLSSSKLRR